MKPNFRPKFKPQKATKNGELFVYGIHVAGRVLEAYPNLVKNVFLRDSIHREEFAVIKDMAAAKKIPVNSVSDKYIDRIVGDVNHQGIIMSLSSFPYTDLTDYLTNIDKTTNPLILMLQEVQDPHNVGAIIRSAALLGASAVCITKNRSSHITSTIAKTSQGTLFDIPIIEIGNVNTTLKLLKDAGFWTYALDQTGGVNLWDTKFDTPMVLVLGNEGGGVRKHTIAEADGIITIPMKNTDDSLNVSVTAGILMYEYSKQINTAK